MLPAVARWGATFCSFRGIGEGGTAFPRESWSRGGGPCGPRYAGAPREHGLAMLGTRVTFISRRKSPKACQGGPPEPPRGTERKVFHFSLPLPLQHIVLLPPQKGLCHKNRPICHFELVSKSVFFLLKLHRGSHPLLSIRGAAGRVPSRMLEGLLHYNQYR